MLETIDNKITNSLVDSGALPETQRENVPQKETAQQTVQKATKFLNNRGVEPAVSANDLVQPTKAPTITPTPEPTIPERTGQMVQNQLGAIRSQSENAQRLAEEQAAFGTFADESSGFDIQNEQLERFGVTPERLQELTDIELQLADNQTASNLTKARIEGAAGQSAYQLGQELTAEDREEAVRSAGLASRAAVLQGNIETGRQLANDAVTIALQDRTFQANAMLNQIADLKDVVNEETRQLLEQEERTYQAELATIEELKTNIANAMVNGATQQEIATMNDPNVSDADKLALAQSVTARGAGEMRDLDIAQAQSSLATQAAQRANIYDQISNRAIEARERALQLANESATDKDVAQAEREAASEQSLGMKTLLVDLATMPGMNDAVGVGFKKSVVGSIPFVSGDAIEGSARADFETAANRLADMFLVQNLDKMTGVLTDKDLEVLRNEGTTIGNFAQSEESWEKERQRLVNMVERGIRENGITVEQAVFYGVLAPEDTETFNSIWETL